MKIKKTLIAIFVVLLSMTFVVGLCACNDTTNNDNPDDEIVNTTINVVVPDGSPAIALAKLFKDKPVFNGYTVNLTIVDGADAIKTKLLNGEANVAIAPTNIGAIIYNNGGQNIKLVATDIQGSLYMVGKEQLSGETFKEKLESLKGKTVYNIGQGATPDITFKYALDVYGIPYQVTETEDPSYVALRYVTSGKELIPLLKKGNAQFGILGEPAVTQANANAGTETVLSLQDLWNDASNTTGGFPQASLFMNKGLLTSEHSAFVEYFLGLLEENNTWVKNNSEVALAALKDGGSTSLTALTPAIVDACNIKLVRANDAKASVEAYLAALYNSKPQVVGGKMPDAGFYANI